MKKKVWVIPVVIAVLIAVLLIGGLAWYLMADWTTTVGICYRDATDDSNRAYRQGLESALEELGYEVLVMDSDNDQAKQLVQLQELVDRTSQVLIVEPVMTSATDELLAELAALEVPAVLVGKAPEADLSAFENITFVGYDGTVPGILQAQMILELPDRGDLNGDGVVSCLILQGPEDDLDAMTYTESCKKALKLGPLGTDVLAVSSGERTREDGMRRCAAQLRTYGKDIEVIFCDCDAIAMGAMDAITEGGWLVGLDVYLVSAGGTAEGLESVSQGKLTGTVLALEDEKRQTTVDAVKALMEGQPVQSYYYLEYTAVTAENVSAFAGE